VSSPFGKERGLLAVQKIIESTGTVHWGCKRQFFCLLEEWISSCKNPDFESNFEKILDFLSNGKRGGPWNWEFIILKELIEGFVTND